MRNIQLEKTNTIDPHSIELLERIIDNGSCVFIKCPACPLYEECNSEVEIAELAKNKLDAFRKIISEVHMKKENQSWVIKSRGLVCSCCGRPFTEIMRRKAMVHPALFEEIGEFHICGSCLRKQQKHSDDSIVAAARFGDC
jgi:hypothetical protein